MTSIASISVASSTEEMSEPTSMSYESLDDEIPIWVRGEQRWISGITNDTTCAQLVEALLYNENIPGVAANLTTPSTTTSTTTTTATASQENQYVITERWRRVEQVLDNKTKILKIWKAWGQTKSEVRLTLRQLDALKQHSRYSRSRSHHMDYDSGRESPVSTVNSAIVRRKRHRSTSAWSKHAKTVHPKSSKKSIEKLMELILEQGETIQQQLTKLRDREHQLAEYEEEQNRSRRHHAENKLGKNYLLETYLNGLHVDGDIENDVDQNNESNGTNFNDKNATTANERNRERKHGHDIDKEQEEEEEEEEITTPGNSDSGVNTEDIATSPEVGTTSPVTNDSSSNSIDNNNDAKRNGNGIGNGNGNGKGKGKGKKSGTLMDTTTATLTNIVKRLSIRDKKPSSSSKKQTTRKLSEKIERTTNREAKLIMEHESRKEFCEKMKIERKEEMEMASAATANSGTNCVRATMAGTDVNGTGQSTSKALNVNDHLAGQIELLEKVIAINKHIQHEEELLVRLNAKIRKYEIDDPNLTEAEMKIVLNQLNTNIENSSNELAKTEHELSESSDLLMNKSKLMKELSKELEALELNENKTNEIHKRHVVIQVPSHQIQIHANNNESNEIPPHQPDNDQIQATSCHNVQSKSSVRMQTPTLTLTQPQAQAQFKSQEQVQPQNTIVPSQIQSTSNQMTLPLSNFIKSGTLPNLISAALKKTTQINAKNTVCGTIPKRPHTVNRTAVTAQQMTTTPSTTLATTTPPAHASAMMIPSPNNAMYVAKNQSFIVPDHVILSQAPLFFQKDTIITTNTNNPNLNPNPNQYNTNVTFNGNFMQSMDQRNINSNNHTIYNFNNANNGNNNSTSMNTNTNTNTVSLSNNNSNSININHTSSMTNVGKIGPKKLINGLYKDPDSDTGLSSLGEDGSQHIGTLV